MTLIYLASPFSDPDSKVRESRYNQTIEATGLLLKAGLFVYSPIVHNYEIAVRYELPKEFEFWREFDSLMVDKCDILAVLMLFGWIDSVGVMYELNLAKESGKEIKYIRLDKLRYADLDKIRHCFQRRLNESR